MRLKALMVLAVLAVLAPAADEKLKEYKSADGNYKVMLFPDPKTQDKKAPGGLTMHMVGNDLGTRALMVIHADMPIPADEKAEQTQKRLDGAKDGAVNSVKGKLIKEAKITLGKHLGREFSAELPMGKVIMKARIYIVGKRLYQVLAIGPKDFVDSANVKKMFDSFELTK
jgi:hypothetical protein